MRIAVAQSRPKVGAIDENVESHMALVDLAVREQAELVVFPELSLTGYEPSLAKQLSCAVDDDRLQVFQASSDQRDVSIAIGVPLATSRLPLISTVVFRPRLTPFVYSKRFLHADEIAWFQPGQSEDCFISEDPKVALAICYELSCPGHAETAFSNGATVYVASVAKTKAGLQSGRDRLANLAFQKSALVLLANSIGFQDQVECCGGSSVWGRDGMLLGELDESREGIIVIDVSTEDITIAMRE